MPGEVYTTANRFRRALLQRERAAASAMVRAYGGIWLRLQAEMAALLAAERRGDVPSAWRRERIEALQRQTEVELRRFMVSAEATVLHEQYEAVQAAQGHVEQLAFDQLDTQARLAATWNHLPGEAVTRMVGHLQNGSPLRALLDEVGPGVAREVGAALTQGIALGKNPRETARAVRQALGQGLDRALLISRTETLRSYREATRESYLANGAVVSGWLWVASKSARTCAMCLAMDGTWHRLGERQDDHPAGRCTSIPSLRGEERPTWETGREWLARQKPEVQEAVLGRAGAAAYRAGAVKLEDFIGRRSSKAWGTTRYALSLKAVLGEKGAEKWYVRSVRQAEARARLVEDLKSMDLDAMIAEVRGAQRLGTLRRHFDDHGEMLGVGTIEEYEAQLLKHLQKEDLALYASRDARYDLLYLIDHTTGEVVMYNLTRHRLHSYYRDQAIDIFVRKAIPVELKKKGETWQVA